MPLEEWISNFLIIWCTLIAKSGKRKKITSHDGLWSYPANQHSLTPDYKDQKFETKATKTYNTSFLSLKRPDFKYVIFKIVEVSPRNPPDKQHSRFGPIPPNVGQIGCAA